MFTSFVTPMFYVLAMGVLLGEFIDDGSADLQGAPTYLAFIAPGLVAAHAMIAVGEVTWPVLGAIKWNRTYLGMVATPLSVADVVAAHFTFVLFRVATTCGVFLLVLALFGVFVLVLGCGGRVRRTAAHRDGLRRADLRLQRAGSRTRPRSR